MDNGARARDRAGCPPFGVRLGSAWRCVGGDDFSELVDERPEYLELEESAERDKYQHK